MKLNFGPEQFSTQIEGHLTPFSAQGTVAFVAPAGAQSIDFTLHIQVDLIGLQQVIPVVIQEKGNANGTNVVRIHTVDLRSNAVLFAAAHYEKWTKVFGTDLKLFEQDGSVTVSLAMSPEAGGHGVAVQPTITNLSVDGILGGILGNSLIGVYLLGWLQASLSHLIDPSNLRASFPSGLAAYNPTITSAAFVDLGSGHLGMAADAAFSLSEEQAQQLIDGLTHK